MSPRSVCALAAVLCLLLCFSVAQSPSRPKLRSPFPLTSFYDTSHPLPAGKPGDLLRSQRFDDYDLPRVLATRILYRSRSAAGRDVAASGVVLTPAGKPPKDGWPVIAWAHPVLGVGRQCAPSLARNLEYGPAFSMWVGLGYAVVASDYAGLGTDFPSAVLDMHSNANDVIRAVTAARAAVPGLGARWVALGDGEGAAAVIALNESVQDSNFLGSVALSGVADLRGVYERLDRTNARTLLLVHTAKALTPDVDLHEVLTDQGTSLYGQLEKSCGIPGNSGADLMKTGWENNRWIQKLFDENRLGNVRASAPLLVIAGEADPVFPVDLVSSTVTRLCHAGDRVQFDRYPGLTLEQVPGETVTEQTSWIRERFAGKPAPGNCH